MKALAIILLGALLTVLVSGLLLAGKSAERTPVTETREGEETLTGEGIVLEIMPFLPGDERSESETEGSDAVGDASGFEETSSYAVAIADSLAFLGSGKAVYVVNISDRSAPREVGHVRLPGPVHDIATAGPYLYVAAGESGLQVVDVADPAAPEILGSVTFENPAEGVAVQGNHAYVAALSAGLRVVDVSDPRAPEEIASCSTEEQALKVVIHDTLAHVAASFGGHRIIDISDPAQPREIGSNTGTSYDRGFARAIAVAGKTAYLAIPDIGGLRNDDFTDPADPNWMKINESLFAPAGLAVDDRYIYVADQEAGLRILEYPEPRNPIEVGMIRLPGSVVDVTVSGSHAFVASKSAGLRIIDVSRPHYPVEVGSFDPVKAAIDIVISGDNLLVADRENGLSIYDISRPQPVRIGHWQGRPERMSLAGQQAFVAAGSEGVRILDLSDPAVPRELGAYRTPGTAMAVAAGEQIALVADGEAGVRVLDLRDPARPREIGSFQAVRQAPSALHRTTLLDAPVAAWDVILTDTIVYAAFDDGVRAIDLTTPEKPAERGVVISNERVFRLLLSGSHLYAAGDDGLRIIDVTDPSHLKTIGFFDTPGFLRGITLSGRYALLTDLTAGLLVVDVSDPAKPVLAASGRLQGEGFAVTVGGNRVFVAQGSAGVGTFELSRLNAASEQPL